MTSQGLRGFEWQISYGPADDRLRDFYLPALSRSIRFHRATGFFSSAALAIAAAGIVRLIQNGGTMRLLCGAQLSADDVEAIKRGEELGKTVGERMVGCLAEPQDQSLRARLEALAWMVAQGTLEIRVVLPKGPDGHPLPAEQAREYYHPKEGVFEDAAGDRIAFSGSSNESEAGWQWNYEVFAVYRSWDYSNAYLLGVVQRFEALWQGREKDWIALPIPEAARARLLRYTPDRAPTTDPLERCVYPPPPRPLPPGAYALTLGQNGTKSVVAVRVEPVETRIPVRPSTSSGRTAIEMDAMLALMPARGGGSSWASPPATISLPLDGGGRGWG